MMSNNDVVTKEWCEQSRENCSARLNDKYSAMKELFTSRLDGIEDQLENMFADIQKVLSDGSIRMSTIDATISKTKDNLNIELELCKKELHQQVTSIMEKVHENELSFASSNKLSITQIIAIASLIIVIAGALIGTWGQTRVNSSIISEMHLKVNKIYEHIYEGK